MDTTVKKVTANTSPRGEMGEICLVTGKALAMRLWKLDAGQGAETVRDYETIGLVLEGKAELRLEGQKVLLDPGDSWLVPKDARHSYRILERFTAVEATCPPAHLHGRDQGSGTGARADNDDERRS